MPPAEHEQADQLLSRKYGWLYKLLTVTARLRRREATFIEVMPG